MRLFNKKKKLSKFTSEGESSSINRQGIKNEYSNDLFTKITLSVFGILGFILCLLDVRDDGMLLKLSIGETEFNYAGSLIGAAITIICIIAIVLQKPEVHIRK